MGFGMYMRKKIKLVLLVSLMIMMFCGCMNQNDKEDNLIIVDNNGVQTTYNLVIASVRDITKSVSVRCTYQAVNEQDLSFSVDGQEIKHVYVEEGDNVAMGQLVATLASDDVEDQILELEYQITRNNQMIKQLEDEKKSDIAMADLDYTYTRQWKVDYDAYQERLQNIEDSYQYSLEDYEDAIAIANLKIEALKDEKEAGNLYASISGTVSYVKDRLVGSSCSMGEKIITITDNTECIFAADKNDYASYFNEGETATMVISTSAAAGTYQVVPYHLNEVEDGLRFTLTDELAADISIDVGTRGIITVVIDTRQAVLSVPTGAVHSGDNRYYVYIEDEDGNLKTTWIEPGLFGNDYVEIISGLSEGDKVVLR